MKSKITKFLFLFFVSFLFCLSVNADDSDVDSNIQKAVQFANGLGESMNKNRATLTTKKELIAHFKEGFSAKLSENLATYYWDKEKKRIDDTAKPVLKAPKEVYVLELGKYRSVAYFESAPDLIRDWKHKKLTITKLGLINKHWIIYDVITMNKLPSIYTSTE